LWFPLPAAADSFQDRFMSRRQRKALRVSTTNTPSSAGLYLPQTNDSLSAQYWAKVDFAIRSASQSSTQQPSASGQQMEPWKKIFSASAPVPVDRKTGGQGLQEFEYVTPAPGMSKQIEGVKRVNVVPYDMALGARLMYGLAEKNTPTPPPSQDAVSAEFVAQCPMIMFSDQLFVRAARCGNPMGEWTDPATNRVVLRWNDRSGGAGLFFGVDSAVSGNGSVTFASLDQKFSVNQFYFELSNCLGTNRYTIQEQIMRVNNIGRGVSSTLQEHDYSTNRQAFFYKYVILSANGTTVAETSLFRRNQNVINITMLGDEVTTGALIATATRQGSWTQSGWRQCSGTKRQWNIDYPLSQRDFQSVATVQDIRVASAVAITLMAFRDESTSSTGIQRTGESHLIWSLLGSILYVILALFILALVCMCFYRFEGDQKCTRLCFKLEAVFLPKAPAKARLPVMFPTY